MAWQSFTVAPELVHEFCDSLVTSKNKNYTVEWTHEYEKDDITGAFLGNFRVNGNVMNGVTLVHALNQKTYQGIDLSMSKELEILMSRMVKEYLKI